jgi:catechol 2,3-dioxygenase
MENGTYKIPANTRIGHVHLKVSDLKRSLDFYCGLLGFELMQMYGEDAAFISAGGYHHHIGLNTWYSKMQLLLLSMQQDYFTQLFYILSEKILPAH